MRNSIVVRAAATALLLVGGFCIDIVAQVQLPLPIVRRATSPPNATVFGRPDVILLARVIQRCDTEDQPDVSGSLRLEPRLVLRMFLAKLDDPIRVNKRASEDPDLSRGEFYFRTRPNEASLAPGTAYILFLDARRDTPNAPEYSALYPEIGFQVMLDQGVERVRPLVRGGVLDAYDGRLLADVIKEIQASK